MTKKINPATRFAGALNTLRESPNGLTPSDVDELLRVVLVDFLEGKPDLFAAHGLTMRVEVDPATDSTYAFTVELWHRNEQGDPVGWPLVRRVMVGSKTF